jgi:hypothetical protein
MSDGIITDYDVVYGDDLNVFTEEMQKSVRDGWQPFGSLVVLPLGDKLFFCQTIVERDDHLV